MWKRLSVLWTVVRGDARLLWRALRHPQAPGWLKLGTLAMVAYVLWPVDLIPEFVPVLGVMDDVVLVPLAMRFLLDRLPAALRAEISRPTA
ncbi:MAG: DUF1232 domain-containing protein [Rubrivivax sp.]|nr:DUF1232 domain-containing protein [Rubrivivax sp.]